MGEVQSVGPVPAAPNAARHVRLTPGQDGGRPGRGDARADGPVHPPGLAGRRDLSPSEVLAAWPDTSRSRAVAGFVRAAIEVAASRTEQTPALA